MLIASGMGGDIVYVVSKNAVAAGPENVAYSAAKADQAHQVRLLAAELGPHGIRVNGVNPDGVVEGSGIFSGSWREARAEAYGVEPERLGEFYAQRTLLGVEVLPDHVADAVVALTGGSLSRTTGLLVPVDGGITDRVRAMTTENKGVPMTMQITPERIVDERGGARAAPRARPRRDAGASRPQRRRRRRRHRRGRAVLGRGAVVGGRHRRHPLRPLPASAASRAPPRRSSTTSPRSNAVTGANRTVSLHVPWDDPADPAALARIRRRAVGIGFDAMNSNTFQDNPSTTGTGRVVQVRLVRQSDADVRKRALEHNLAVIELGVRARRDRDHGVAGRRHQPPGPGQLPAPVRTRGRVSARAARVTSRRLGDVHRAQALRARVLLERELRLGFVAAPRAARGTASAVPRRPRAPSAEREHRAGREPAGDDRSARRLPLQRLQVRRRRPHRRLDPPVPVLPRGPASCSTPAAVRCRPCAT